MTGLRIVPSVATEEMLAGLIGCLSCGGSGVEVYGTTVYEPGCAFSHDSSDERPCSECRGSGWVLGEYEPAGMEWTL